MPVGSADEPGGCATGGCGASCVGSGAHGSGGTMDSRLALHSQLGLRGCCCSAAGGKPGPGLEPPRADEPSRRASLGYPPRYWCWYSCHWSHWPHCYLCYWYYWHWSCYSSWCWLCLRLCRAAGSRAGSGIPWRVLIASGAACDGAGCSSD